MASEDRRRRSDWSEVESCLCEEENGLAAKEAAEQMQKPEHAWLSGAVRCLAVLHLAGLLAGLLATILEQVSMELENLARAWAQLVLVVGRIVSG
jgi:hypothetical protein